MRKIISFFVRYKIWTNVLLFAVFGFGLMALSQLRYSFFPESEPEIIIVQVAYPGASPEEVAEGVIIKIEENLDGLELVERVTSVSQENSGTVTVEVIQDGDIDKALADVKNAVDRINSFPADAEKPVIFEQKFSMLSLSIVLYGEADLYNLKTIADELRDEFLAAEEISQVEISGLPALEFSIEVSEANLRRYQLTFDEITQAVARANVNISGGKIETETEEILIRAWGRNYRAVEFENIPIRGNSDGTIIYLRDIAKISEIWENIPDKIYFNGQPAVQLSIDQTSQEDILAIADRAKEIIRDFNLSNSTVRASILRDGTVPLTQRISLLTRNGIFGLILIIITLGFFLKMRLSLWVSIGIPFSFAGMFIVANIVGITINVMSLFGMIIVVGILVDDAIVVAENIYSHYERGKSALVAAVDGAVEVLAPVTTSVLTTIIAFIPYFYLAGRMGQFIWQMALVVIASLSFSLLEAFTILPSHLAHSKGLQPDKKPSRVRKRIEKIIYNLTHKIYKPALTVALRHKFITIITPVAFILLTIGLIGGGLIGLTFFPYIDSDFVPINISLVTGRQEAVTDSILAEIEKVCWQVNDEFKQKRADGRDVILGIEREIGQNDLGQSGSHAGRVSLQLLDDEVRDLESYKITDRVRELLKPFPDVQKMTFGAVSRFGKPVSISLLGNDISHLAEARDLLKRELENFSELKDITDSDQEGRREINITLKPRAYALGLTLQDVARQVRQGFFGQEVQRIQRGRDEIRVWVRYTEDDRKQLGFIDQMRIRTADGREFPFSELAGYSIKRGITRINHLDRKREIKVEANLADVEADLPPILEEIQMNILPPILAQVSGVTAQFEGQSRDQAKMQRSMFRTFPLALLGMFILGYHSWELSLSRELS